VSWFRKGVTGVPGVLGAAFLSRSGRLPAELRARGRATEQQGVPPQVRGRDAIALATAEVEKGKGRGRGRSALSIADKGDGTERSELPPYLLGLTVRPFSCDYAGEAEELTSGRWGRGEWSPEVIRIPKCIVP
jgi:hypothetical protein